MSEVGYVVKKEAASNHPLAGLTPGEIKGITAAVGIGTLLALLRGAAKMNEDELHEAAGELNAARADRASSEVARARSLDKARQRTVDHMRVAMGRGGVDVMHPGLDPMSPAFVMEAARRRQPSSVGSWGRDRDFIKDTSKVKGFVGF